MKPDYDIVFVGAGLSGVSLAARLAALPHPPRMLLVDPRHEFVRDRTWCYWQVHENPFDAAITNRWHNWTVRTATAGTTCRDARAPYVRIPADRLHQIAAEKLTGSPQIEFLRGVFVESIEEHADRTALHLSDGRRIESSWVFDSRPPQNENTPWRQIFRGLELHSPEAKLDTSTVTLMDFQSAGPEGIRFFYVLPVDAQTALVEDTWLVPPDKPPTFSDDEILSYAAKNLCPANWQIRHREEGNLPMDSSQSVSSALFAHGPSPSRSRGTPVTVEKNQRVIPWGTAAGAVRASSGYAFSRIQAASQRMAAAWQRSGRPDPAAVHGSPLLDWMDRVFLRAMTNQPERVPEFFFRLFNRVPPDALIRFLESEPRPTDILHVMRALPIGPFLRAALP